MQRLTSRVKLTSRRGGWLAAIGLPALLTVGVLNVPNWPAPYLWQYTTLTVIVTLIGGSAPGILSLIEATAATWFWTLPGLPRPLHPGLELFILTNIAVVTLIGRIQHYEHERAMLLQGVIQSIPDAVFVGTRDHMTIVNEGALQTFGVASVKELNAAPDVLARRVNARHADGRPLRPYEQPFIRALQGEHVVEDLLLHHATLDADVIVRVAAAPVRVGDEIVAAVATNSDITARSQMEQAVRESEQRYRKTLDNMLEGCLIVAPDWKVVYANDTYVRHARLADRYESIVGHDLRVLLPGFEPSVFFTLWNDCMVRRVPGYIDAEFEFPDGSTGWFETRVSPVPEGVFGLTLDITDRKRAEQASEAARRSAERARAVAEEANQAKDHFLAILSHELRTPLTPVLAGLSLLRRDDSLSERARGYLEVLRRNVEVESRLIDDLLDVTRITHGKVDISKRPVEMRTILERAVDVCRNDIETRKLHFGVHWETDEPCIVEADDARLEQVFWNLLKNAIKFTPKGGCVGVRALLDGDEVIVEVTDSGIGIAPEDATRIFDAFTQVERTLARQFGGLGLGLTICRALVQKHGGTIAARSEGLGRGSTFTVRLPVLVLQTPANREQRKQPRLVQRLSVLVVEDHGDSAQMIKMMLESSGHEVTIAGDVAAALDTLGHHQFDLILSDIGLPDRSGHDLLREVRRLGKPTPAIALSGYGHETDIATSKAAGFCDHLVKPVDVETLLETVDAVILSGRPANRKPLRTQ